MDTARLGPYPTANLGNGGQTWSTSTQTPPITPILALGSSTGAGYAFHKGRDFAYLLKWSSSFAMSVLWCDRPALPLPHTNLVLTFALTRLTTNYVITTRVLDKADPRIVLFQHSSVDTPGRDATLTAVEFQDLTGIPFLDLSRTLWNRLPPQSVWL